MKISSTADGTDIIIDNKTDGIIIKAAADHTATDSTFNLFTETAVSQWFPNKSTDVKADINVGGTINASKGVNISADANTFFQEGLLLNIVSTTGLKDKVLGSTGLTLDASYVDKTNAANITVGNINAGGTYRLR